MSGRGVPTRNLCAGQRARVLTGEAEVQVEVLDRRRCAAITVTDGCWNQLDGSQGHEAPNRRQRAVAISRSSV